MSVLSFRKNILRAKSYVTTWEQMNICDTWGNTGSKARERSDRLYNFCEKISCLSSTSHATPHPPCAGERAQPAGCEQWSPVLLEAMQPRQHSLAMLAHDGLTAFALDARLLICVLSNLAWANQGMRTLA